jgi:hypothetical protein
VTIVAPVFTQAGLFAILILAVPQPMEAGVESSRSENAIVRIIRALTSSVATTLVLGISASWTVDAQDIPSDDIPQNESGGRANPASSIDRGPSIR